jgi:hypothetical protein
MSIIFSVKIETINGKNLIPFPLNDTNYWRTLSNRLSQTQPVQERHLNDRYDRIRLQPLNSSLPFLIRLSGEQFPLDVPPL